ncbi:MAG: hypothetical protein J6Y23_02440 [Prevotella sp.]|nr:hypothetical protein [Prevotella sp.]
MKTTIVESRLTGKKSPETCEDGIVATDNFIAVIDGSTSKAIQQMKPGMRNGRAAMLLVCEGLQALAPDANVQQCCDIITTLFRDTYCQYGVNLTRLIAHPEERMTASAAIYSCLRHEVWMVGDCQCLVNDIYYDNPKPDEDRIAHERAAIIHEMLAKGETDIASLRQHDVGRDRVVAQIVQTCHDQNVRFSVFDGFPVAMEKVKVIPVPLGSKVVLASDGYPFLFPTLEESEAALANQLATDPLCIHHHIATKAFMEGQLSFDDRAFVKFEV